MFVFCFLNNFMVFGIVFAFGAFFVELLDKFQKDRATTATLQSLLVGVTLSFGVVSGALISKLGLPWVTLLSCILVPLGFGVSFFATRIEHLYISIGIVSGVGISMGHISAVVIVGRIFTGKKRVLLLAVLNASSSLSGLVYPYFINWLMTLFELSGTFLILGAVYSNTFPLFILCWMNRSTLKDFELSSRNSKIKTNTKNEAPSPTIRHKGNFIINGVQTLREMVNTTYLLLLFACAISAAGINGYTGMILDICRWKGFSKSRGLFTFVIFNIANVVSRLLPGVLKQKRGFNSFIYPIISTISGCVGQLLLYKGQSYILYVLGTCLSGVAIGGVVSAQFILVLKAVPREFIPVGSGLLFTMSGVLSSTTGPIFGSLRDNFGTYGSVLLTVSVVEAIAAIFFVLALVYRRIDNAKKQSEDTTENSIEIIVTHL
ncbi:monocarboxylate transporter 12-like isoform X2 [Mercenaria mercenaria]|nr:monocarboxylate transporter 12-like isoform X2 [Mercenaria mercenaria]